MTSCAEDAAIAARVCATEYKREHRGTVAALGAANLLALAENLYNSPTAPASQCPKQR